MLVLPIGFVKWARGRTGTHSTWSVLADTVFALSPSIYGLVNPVTTVKKLAGLLSLL
jgi:hypothetical protein